MDFTQTLDPETSATSPPLVSQSSSPADQSEIENYLNKYQYASEPSYFTRPNRYHGPPSTWRSWTADDRAVAESLDAIRASDLSVHLYNAFDLKRRSRSVPHSRHFETKIHVRPGSNSDDDQQVADQEFTPPEVWTAWPLRSRHIPWSSDSCDANGLSTRMRRNDPSTSMEDALLATTLRHARTKWDARKSEVKPSQATATTGRNWKVGHDLTKQESKNSANTGGDQEDSTSPRSTDRDNAQDSEAAANESDAASIDDNLPEGVQFFSSQAFAVADSSSSSDDEEPTLESEEEYPIFSVDDDRSYNLLRPSVRHLLTKLDDLLDGLHKARAAYAVKNGNTTSRSRSQSAFTDTERTEDERLIRSGSRAAAKKQGRKRKRSLQSSDPEQLQRSTSRGRPTVRTTDKKNQGYGLRDWADIMGMATLTGWNIETVARASERCARLFDQNMSFRTFYQDVGDGDAGSHEPWFEEEVAYLSTASRRTVHIPREDLPSQALPAKLQKLEYIRTSSRCARCQLHKIRCEPARSTTIVNLTQRVPCAACSSVPELAAPCPGIMVRPRTKPTVKTCPYPNCSRSDPMKPFLKNYHLQRHLTDVHGHIFSPPTSPMMRSPLPNDGFRSTPEEQIRPSAILKCPIPSCPKSTRTYKRPTRLYDHIRTAHPEFDVDSFKKIVGKTGGRGRYDRSRSRSKGRATVRDDGGDVVDSVDTQGEQNEGGTENLGLAEGDQEHEEEEESE